MVMRYIRFFIFCLSLVFTTLITEGKAQDAPIAILDMQKVLTEAIPAKALRSDLEGQRKKVEASLALKKGELQAMQADLEKQKSLLSANAKEEKEKIFEQKVKDFQRNAHDANEDFQKKMALAIEGIVNESRKVAEDLAKAKGYSLVLERDPRVLLYFNARYEITSEVIAQLNKRKGS